MNRPNKTLILKGISALAAGALVFAGFSVIPASVFAVSSNPGDIIINEFVSDGDEWVELLNTSSNDISLSGFKLSELENPQTVPTEILLLELSGTIPAGGILVFNVSGLNNSGDSIALYNGAIDNPANLWQRATYGSVTGYAAEAGLGTAPTDEQSAAFAGSSWSVDDSPSKGWFNDAGEPGKAPLLSGADSIESFLDTAGINSNIGELENPSETPDTELGGALYFEKEGNGKIVFATTLNLSAQNTVAVLQELGEKMEMSDGHIEFDSETADAMNATGAKIYMYELDFTSTPNIVVKNDDGDTISGTGIIEDVSYNPETGELSFTAAHFTQFDAEDASLSDNVYVSADGGSDEDGDGSEENPYQTIQKGIDSVSASGTVNVASGEYEESLEIEKNLTLLGDPGDSEAGPGGDAPEIYFGNECGRVISIEENEDDVTVNDVTVKGFVLEGDGCKPVVRVGQGVSGAVISDNEIKNGKKGVDLSPESSQNTVTNNLIHDNDNEGVWIGGSTDNTISDNEIYDNARGVGLGEGGNCDEECGNISGNEITGNHIYDNRDIRSGIHIEGEDVSFSELTISNNTIADNSGYGIYFDRVEDGELTISENEITDNSAAGIYLSGESGGISDSTVTLEDNTISNNVHEGIYVERVDEESTLDIIGNTITENNQGDDCDGDCLESDSPGVYISYVYNSAVTLRENTISDTNLGRGVFICDECSSSALTFEDNTIENNNSDGIFVSNLRSGTLDVSGNTIKGTTGPGFELTYSENDGDAPSTVTISENTFDRNFYGVYLGSGVEEDDEPEMAITIGENNIITNNDNTGIFIGSPVSGVTITGNTIQNNGVESETTGIVVQSASGNSAHNNSILDNGSHGVNNEDEEENVFDASDNWWGSAGGPEGEGNNGIGGNVDFDPWYTNAARTTLSSGVVTNASYGSPIGGQAYVPPGATEVELDDETVLDLSAGLADDTVILQSGVDGEPIVLTNLDLDDVAVSIPDETEITGPDGWDGIIQPPMAGTPDGTPPAGFSVGDTVISVGSPGGTLVFDKPVTITLLGVTGAVGYRPAGSDAWTEITAVCRGTYAEPINPVSPGECYISNGTDTKIVTFHFTTFGSLSPTSSPTPSSGGNTSAGSNFGGGSGGGAGGGSGSTGGNSGGQVLGASVSNSQGQVLGASTMLGASTSTAPNSCAPLLVRYMRRGMNNDSGEVKKLQQFLNDNLGANRPVTGFFGLLTEAAANAFQLKYAEQILKPWGITEPTGYVYKLTLQEINLLHCSAPAASG